MDSARFGDLIGEFANMFSAEASLPDGSVVMCGDIDDLIAEWVVYLATPN